MQSGKFAKALHKRVFALSRLKKPQPEMAKMLQKTSVGAPGLSTDQCGHPFV